MKEFLPIIHKTYGKLKTRNIIKIYKLTNNKNKKLNNKGYNSIILINNIN